MAEQKDLVIRDFHLGIGPSPHTGFGEMRNLDISTIPGIVRINNLLEKKSSTTVTALIHWIVKNPLTPTELFALDSGGQVYTSTDSGATWSTIAGETAGGSGQGMVIWKDYLFVARAAALDVYGPLSGVRAWSNSWQAITSDTAWHPMIVSYNDGNLYGGAGKYVFSIIEETTFAPGTGASYTPTAQALDLPANYRIKCLAELGNDLQIGTWMGTNIYDFRVADLFSWNRSDPSFGTPVQLNENGVNAMINKDNTLYIMAGIEGRVYKSNGVSATPIAQIPSSIVNLEGGLYLDPLPGGMMSFKSRLFFAVSAGGSGTPGGCGVWSLDETNKGNILNFEQTISTGSDGSSSVVKVGSVLPFTRDILLSGWKDGATFGIDKTTVTSRVTDYGAYLDTPLYQVGTSLIKRQFSQGEFHLAKELATNEGIKIAYRTNLTDSFTTLTANSGVFDYTLLGAVTSHEFIADVPACEFVQFRIYLTGTTTTPQVRMLIFQ